MIFKEQETPISGSAIQQQSLIDSDGLSRSYQHGDYAFIGDTPKTSGTHTHRDSSDDITMVPSALYDIPALQQHTHFTW